jgi:AGZA family xanthine/uracil permease-like MFS transporter
MTLCEPLNMNKYFEKFFQLQANDTNVSTEVLAGCTTFITMVYIIFINPQMMAASGMDQGASFVGTCLAAALACFVMGLYANWPVGMAPGMGLNAFFTYTVVGEMGYSWQIALGAVFLAGIIFVIMSVTRLRGWMLQSISLNLRISMGAGVGLFIGFIGLKSGGIIVANSATYLSLGDFTQPQTLLAALGFLLIAILSIRRIPGAIIIGIFSVTGIAAAMNLVSFNGLVAAPPSLGPTLMQLDIVGAFDVAMISVIIAFLFVNLFDTAGTLLGVANQAGLTNDQGHPKDLDRALKADSSSSVMGAFLGCPPVTSYVESAAGIEAGGRTGLTAVVVGSLFLLSIFFSPLAAVVPAYATAGALIYVAILMLSSMQALEWSDMTEVMPALVTIVMIPLSFSIANGIAMGFITFVAVKFFTGKRTDITLGAWFLAVIFLAKFALL